MAELKAVKEGQTASQIVGDGAPLIQLPNVE
jgi:hypothetical protein